MKRFTAFFLLCVITSAGHALPSIKHWRTANEARVYFIAAPELPIIDLEISFDAGSARDGDKYGLASLVNGMLPEGADGLNADEILERFAALGVNFGADSGYDMAGYSLRSLTDPKILQPSLALFARILGKPDFPAEALERERKRMLQSLAYEKQSPGTLASKAFYKALYGSHPYANPSDGTEKTVRALKRKDLVDFYRRYYTAANAVIAIVGNVDETKAREISENLAAALEKGKAASSLPPVPIAREARRIHIQHPSTQTHVLLGQPGYARHDPDYFTLYVGNHILGGNGLVSKLSKEVREERGLSYSVYSYFSPLRAAGPFTAGLQTRNDQRGEAVQVMREVIQKFIEEGPSEEELAEAKKNLSGGFALRIDSNQKILGYLTVIGFYQLPLDYLDVWVKQIEKVTLADIQDAFKRRLDLDKMVLVTVGGSVEAENSTAAR